MNNANKLLGLALCLALVACAQDRDDVGRSSPPCFPQDAATDTRRVEISWEDASDHEVSRGVIPDARTLPEEHEDAAVDVSTPDHPSVDATETAVEPDVPVVDAQDATSDAGVVTDVPVIVDADGDIPDASSDAAATWWNISMNLHWHGEPIYSYTRAVFVRSSPGARGVICGQVAYRAPSDSAAHMVSVRLGGRADISSVLRAEDLSRLVTSCSLFDGTTQVGRTGAVEADGTVLISEMGYVIPRAQERILTISCDAGEGVVPGTPNVFAIGVSFARDALIALDDSGTLRPPVYGRTLIDQLESRLPAIVVSLNP